MAFTKYFLFKGLVLIALVPFMPKDSMSTFGLAGIASLVVWRILDAIESPPRNMK
jgi:hypothetical protein